MFRTEPHSPNCCCAFCANKRRSEPKSSESELESGISVREPLGNRQREHKDYLKSNFEKNYL